MNQRRWIAALVLLAAACSATSLRAQESVPKAEIFGTYSYFSIDGGKSIPRQSLQGWGAGISPNFNRSLGATVQLLGGYGKVDENILIQRTGAAFASADLAAHGFLAGPELNLRGSTFRLFAHGLAGVATYRLKNVKLWQRGFLATPPSTFPAPAGFNESETNMAWGGGGGMDMRINPAMSVRIIQVDFIAEQSTPARKHLVLGFGIVGHLGGQR